MMIIILSSCSDIEDISDADFVSDVSVAIPLINTQLTLDSVSERLNGLTSIVIAPNGQATIKYRSEVIRQDADDIFPVFPVIIDVPIVGPNSIWSLESLASLTDAFADNEIRKAIFQDNNVFFKLQHASDDDVIFRILNLKK